MKNTIFAFALLAIIISGCKKDDDSVGGPVTISMGSHYASDVYYSLKTGETKQVDKSTWDIAFSVPLQTAAILINEGAGVELYCVGDTNNWNSVDTANIRSKGARYNNKSDWSDGAFNQNNLPPFSFGWGTYNMTAHNVYGDSIYIIFLSNGACKKFSIKERVGATDTYVLHWADPDGSNEVNASFSPKAYSNKHFIHYSIVNKKEVVAEPDKENWDLLFTNYIVKIPAGPSTYMNYAVMGVLAKQGIQLSKVTGIDPALAALSDTTSGFTSNADAIGWDWKTFNQTTMVYSLAENTCYFAKLTDGKIYRIYFTGFTGSSTGDITFETKLMN